MSCVAEQEEKWKLSVSSRLLSESVAAHKAELLQNLTIIAELDAVFARAKYSRAIDGTEPVVNGHGVVRIKKGRHPSAKGGRCPDRHLAR